MILPIPNPTVAKTNIALLGMQVEAVDLDRKFDPVAINRQLVACRTGAKLVQGEKEYATGMHSVSVFPVKTI